jgi:hypothetical protein
MPDTTAVIFFVGLTVFTNSIQNDCGVKAILPRVVYNSPFTGTPIPHRLHSSARPQQLIAQAGGRGRFGGLLVLEEVQHVEDHEAVLVFPTASYHPSSNWGAPEVVKRNGTNTTYSFVRLDGDYVRFISNSAIIPTCNQPPTTLPASVKLPPLRNAVCPAKMQSLRSEYLPPYTGAAAVFDLPQGTLESCLSTPSANKRRLDTKLTLTSPGPYFVVSASTMKTRKELRLKANSAGFVELMVTNLPKRYLAGDTTELSTSAMNGLKHDNAYYAMGATANGSCNTSLEGWFNSLATNQVPPNCQLNGLGLKLMAGAPGQILDKVAAASFECSNTQWP